MWFRIWIALFFLFQIGYTFASHRFNVQINNVSGQQIEVRNIMIDHRGPGLGPICSLGQEWPTLNNGAATQCVATANTRNWRRKVSVTFFCKGSNMIGTQTYPRNGSWFPSDQLDDGNKYKVAVKKNDC